jgi:phage gp29-like protein
MAKGLWIDDKTFIRFNDGGARLSDEIATRQRAVDFYGLNMYLPNPDPVLKKMGKDIAVYTDLKVDSRVKAGIISRKAGVKSLEWEIDRGKSKSRQVKIVEQLFKRLDLEQIISEILEAPLFGYQPLEVIWENRDGLIFPRDVIGKPQRWFVFGAEDNSLRFRTKGNYSTGEELPPRKFLIPRFNASYDNPYGEPLLSSCFWPVTFKKGGWRFWVTFAEKYGMPFAVGKHPRGAQKEEVNALLDMLEQMVQDAVAAIPDDSSVELKEAAGKGASVGLYKSLIDTANSEISTALLGHAGAGESTPGKLGNEDAALTVRKDIVDSDKKLVEATINQLIGWIFELNWGGSGEQPVFGLYEEEDVDKTLAERDGTLSKDAGVKFTKAYFRKAYGFEDEDIEITRAQSTGATNPPPGLTAQFAEEEVFPGQQAVDDLIESLSPEMMQKQMETVLKPVFQFFEESGSYQEAMEKLAELYPQLDTGEIEQQLQKMIFLSEAFGHVTADD